MSFNEEHIREVTESIWSNMLGAHIAPCVIRQGAAAPQPYVRGCVHIYGGWEGAITIGCSRAFARRAAGVMFELAPEAASPDEVRDALGELANIVGGNIKAMLPGPSKLSLPDVTEGSDHGLAAADGATLGEVWFECDGEPLVVAVHARVGARTEA